MLPNKRVCCFRMLFAYSYFNVLWNKMASERLRRYGLKAVEGDCVIADLDATFGDDLGHGFQLTSPISATDYQSAPVTNVLAPPLRVQQAKERRAESNKRESCEQQRLTR